MFTNVQLTTNVGGGPVIRYSLVQGGFSGTGIKDGDPLFVNPAGQNLRLRAGSPCIDAGDTTALPAGILVDLDGNGRVADGRIGEAGGGIASGLVPATVDIGAYEFQDDTWSPDTDGDGVVNVTDLVDVILGWGPCP